MSDAVLAGLAIGIAAFWSVSASRNGSRLSRLILGRDQSARGSYSPGNDLASGSDSASGIDSWPTFVIHGVGILAGLGVWAVLGDVLGVVLGVFAAVGLPRFLRSLESSSTRERRASLLSDAPLVAELLVACMQTGASDQRAISVVVEALDGPALVDLQLVVTNLSLGSDPIDAWRHIIASGGRAGDEDSPLAPIARAFIRSAQTGAPLSQLLTRVAADLRTKHRASLEESAKTIGVKVVAPLGLCFLPAFVLIGVVPLVASLFLEASPF